MVNEINNTRLGNIIVSALCKSTKTYNIDLDSKSGGSYSPTTNKISVQNSFTQLIHELFHAYIDDSGHGEYTPYNEGGARYFTYACYKEYYQNYMNDPEAPLYIGSDQFMNDDASELYNFHVTQLQNHFNIESFDFVANSIKNLFGGYDDMKSESPDSQKNFVINFFTQK